MVVFKHVDSSFVCAQPITNALSLSRSVSLLFVSFFSKSVTWSPASPAKMARKKSGGLALQLFSKIAPYRRNAAKSSTKFWIHSSWRNVASVAVLTNLLLQWLCLSHQILLLKQNVPLQRLYTKYRYIYIYIVNGIPLKSWLLRDILLQYNMMRPSSVLALEFLHLIKKRSKECTLIPTKRMMRKKLGVC